MPLPTDFSPWEHLQSTVISAYNRIVRDEFSDIEDDDSIATSRASLKTACLVQDSDSAPMVAIRMMMFYMTVRKAQDLQRPVYGIPYTAIQETRGFVPQIILHFMEDLQDVDSEAGFNPVYGQASIRLMNQTSTTISEGELRSYANSIKSIFGTGQGYIWRKGRQMTTYTDPERGYRLHIACRSESDGKSVITDILRIQNHTPDWQYCNFKQNEEPATAYPTNPGSVTILGKSRKKPRKRPVADVRFRYATCHIYGLPNPISLYDKTGYHRNALLTDYQPVGV